MSYFVVDCMSYFVVDHVIFCGRYVIFCGRSVIRSEIVSGGVFGLRRAVHLLALVVYQVIILTPVMVLPFFIGT